MKIFTFSTAEFASLQEYSDFGRMNSFEKPVLKKIAVIGPECTGKTDLSKSLARRFKTEWVPEYARGYIDNLIRQYEQSDLLTIAHGQLRLEDEFGRTANGALICDTNLYVIKVWSLFKYGTVDEEILARIQARPYDLYLLTYIDVPWEDDPLREHPSKREELYKMYLHEMKNQPVPYIEIKGAQEERIRTAVEAIEKILSVP